MWWRAREHICVCVCVFVCTPLIDIIYRCAFLVAVLLVRVKAYRTVVL